MLSRILCVLPVLMSLPVASLAQPLPQAEVHFVQGFGAGSLVYNEVFQKARQRNFKTAKIGFYPRYVDNASWPLLNKARTLECIERADIFVFSGHSGTPPGASHHVLQIANTAGTARDNINAFHLTTALKGRAAPRLVVINGCNTTDPADGVRSPHRISDGFGINASTKGRAYIGWSSEVVPTMGENTIGRVFNHWTTIRPDGTFPTLNESLAAAHTLKNPVLIGDGSLRYKTAFVLTPDNDPRVKLMAPLRLFLDATGPQSAQATIDFGAANEPMLKRLGYARLMEMCGNWQNDRYVFADAKFKQLVTSILVAMTTTTKDTEATVHEAAWTARPDGARLRVTLRLNVEIGEPNAKPFVLKAEYRLLGTPETPAPRK
jgi:hypothetical protein